MTRKTTPANFIMEALFTQKIVTKYSGIKYEKSQDDKNKKKVPKDQVKMWKGFRHTIMVDLCNKDSNPKKNITERMVAERLKRLVKLGILEKTENIYKVKQDEESFKILVKLMIYCDEMDRFKKSDFYKEVVSNNDDYKKIVKQLEDEVPKAVMKKLHEKKPIRFENLMDEEDQENWRYGSFWND